MIGWWSILQILSRRETESIPFSVPDRHVLWNRAEDDILVQVVVKYTTSDVFSRSWRQVTSGLPGLLPQQCKECYRVVDTVTQLTFVFLSVYTHRCLGYHNHTTSMTVTAKLIHHCVSKDSDTA